VQTNKNKQCKDLKIMRRHQRILIMLA